MKLYEVELKSSLGVKSKWYSWSLSDLREVIEEHIIRGFSISQEITFTNKKVLNDEVVYLQPQPWYIIKGIHY